MLWVRMRLKDIFRLIIIISSMIVFTHILLTAPFNYEYAFFHVFINLGILLLNLVGEIIITAIDKGVGF
jgi:hypothetical protein